jgi:prepilin-type N-terminal cleavage/methylation domain-containing protein
MKPQRRRHALGLTLIELLIAMTVFGATMTMIYGIFVLSRNAQEKGSTQSEAYRAVFLALERVEDSLRGCQLLIPVDWESHVPLGSTPSITYLYPTIAAGRVVVDGTGTPVWAGRARIEFSAPKLMQYDETTGKSRQLSDLGPGGDLSFLRPERDLLRVSAKAVRIDPQSDTPTDYEFTVTLRLPNQP